MARPNRRPELWLLLAVAPFFASCDDGGPEERRCVGPDGFYLDDQRCDPAGPVHHAGAHYVYVPHGYYGGPGHHAGAFRSATTPGSGHAAVSRGGFGTADGPYWDESACYRFTAAEVDEAACMVS